MRKSEEFFFWLKEFFVPAEREREKESKNNERSNQ